MHIHLREGDLDFFPCKALGNPAIDRILHFIGEAVFPRPDPEDKIQTGLGKFGEENRGRGIGKEILSIFYCILGNFKKYLLDPSGIGSVGNRDRDGNPQFSDRVRKN
jgi:hypothetical protein